jgi:hypothetical protein
VGRHTDISGHHRGGAEFPVEEVSPKSIRLPGDSALITYRVRLDVPRELILDRGFGAARRSARYSAVLGRPPTAPRTRAGTLRLLFACRRCGVGSSGRLRGVRAGRCLGLGPAGGAEQCRRQAERGLDLRFVAAEQVGVQVGVAESHYRLTEDGRR